MYFENKKRSRMKYSSSLSRREEISKKIYASSPQTTTLPERIDFVWEQLESIESIPLRTKITVECVFYSYDIIGMTPPQNEAYIRQYISKKTETRATSFLNWFC